MPAENASFFHGRINTIFFFLTLFTVIGFESILQFMRRQIRVQCEARQALRIHLCFSIPSALLLPVMLFTGKTRRRSLHLTVGVLFTILWLGTFVTGVFFLPHD